MEAQPSSPSLRSSESFVIPTDQKLALTKADREEKILADFDASPSVGGGALITMLSQLDPQSFNLEKFDATAEKRRDNYQKRSDQAPCNFSGTMVSGLIDKNKVYASDSTELQVGLILNREEVITQNCLVSGLGTYNRLHDNIQKPGASARKDEPEVFAKQYGIDKPHLKAFCTKPYASEGYTDYDALKPSIDKGYKVDKKTGDIIKKSPQEAMQSLTKRLIKDNAPLDPVNEVMFLPKKSYSSAVDAVLINIPTNTHDPEAYISQNYPADSVNGLVKMLEQPFFHDKPLFALVDNRLVPMALKNIRAENTTDPKAEKAALQAVVNFKSGYVNGYTEAPEFAENFRALLTEHAPDALAKALIKSDFANAVLAIGDHDLINAYNQCLLDAKLKDREGL
ncbi:hypothetical protein [Aeromonas jandaei]|uniref:hypothetical protein n=1 Tax=Aeromonas jandaei TaxID=650 RepID=UPI003BA1002C